MDFRCKCKTFRKETGENLLIFCQANNSKLGNKKHILKEKKNDTLDLIKTKNFAVKNCMQTQTTDWEKNISKTHIQPKTYIEYINDC